MLLKFGLNPIQDSRKLPEKYLKWIESRSIDGALNILCLKDDFIGHQYHKLVINLIGCVNLLNGKTIIETMVRFLKIQPIEIIFPFFFLVWTFISFNYC